MPIPLRHRTRRDLHPQPGTHQPRTLWGGGIYNGLRATLTTTNSPITALLVAQQALALLHHYRRPRHPLETPPGNPPGLTSSAQ